VTLMLVTAISALFIRGGRLPNIAGYSPIHLLVPVTLFGLFGSFWFLARGNIRGHRRVMQWLYIGACVVAGAFTLLPGRFLGDLIWVEWLGLKGPSMTAQIFSNTPVWIWGLLAALLALGFSQARSRTAGLPRLLLMPLGLGAFSLWGTISAFGAPAAVLGSWFAACVLLLLVVAQIRIPAGVSYGRNTRQFALPGSWIPMALILGIFITKYAVGVSLAMQPDLKANANFMLAISTLYGAFSGIFAGRTIRLLRLAMRPAANPIPVLNP
jgi:Predicted membrane protein (DUF2306)